MNKYSEDKYNTVHQGLAKRKTGKNNIEHKGIVKKIVGKSLKVSIISTTSCASCSAKGICNVSEIEEKEVEVKEYEGEYRVGEHVKVFYRQILGFRALFLGYILPFLLIFVGLIISLLITNKEGLSGLIALSTLIPYYIVLYLRKDKINDKFSFSIKKI